MLGLKEVITYSIEAEDDLLKLGEKNFIKILNPLRQQENSLRSNLLLGMIKAISYNLNRSRSNLRFFEIANVYSKNKEDFCEVPFLSLGINSEEDSFFYLKGIIEKILGCLNIENHAFKEESLDNFTNALMVIINHQCIGFLGRLDRKISSSFDLKGDLFFAQLEVTSLLKTRAIKAYKPFSPYPVVWRDVSIALRSDKKFSSIEGIIKEKGSSLYDYRVIDVYRGKDLPSGYSAFTLRIFYQSIGKTLTSGEVDSIHNSIRESLSKKEGIILR
jgi:phenylalanyl-tRNA synthetase beta chain